MIQFEDLAEWEQRTASDIDDIAQRNSLRRDVRPSVPRCSGPTEKV
jgi:hypothetical protein